MRIIGAPRNWDLIAALMLAIAVAACGADEDTTAPGETPSVESAAPSDGSGLPTAEPEEAAPEADPE